MRTEHFPDPRTQFHNWALGDQLYDISATAYEVVAIDHDARTLSVKYNAMFGGVSVTHYDADDKLPLLWKMS